MCNSHARKFTPSTRHTPRSSATWSWEHLPHSTLRFNFSSLHLRDNERRTLRFYFNSLDCSARRLILRFYLHQPPNFFQRRTTPYPATPDKLTSSQREFIPLLRLNFSQWRMRAVPYDSASIRLIQGVCHLLFGLWSTQKKSSTQSQDKIADRTQSNRDLPLLSPSLLQSIEQRSKGLCSPSSTPRPKWTPSPLFRSSSSLQSAKKSFSLLYFANPISSRLRPQAPPHLCSLCPRATDAFAITTK